MAESIRCSKLVPFSISEEQVRDRFIDWIIEDENAPIDVAYTAKITRIKKLFYPVCCFQITYSASWSATSIYEHQEEYEVYTPKTVYIDYKGRQHDRPGEDYLDDRGRQGPKLDTNTTRHPWQPQQIMERSTKKKTVVDSTERTWGNIGPYSNTERIAMPKERILKTFLEKADVSNAVSCSDDYQKNATILPFGASEQVAWQQADDLTFNLAASQGKEQVPGNRFTDFSVSNYRSQYSMTAVLVSVYEITYEHNGKLYTCWLYGSGKDTFLCAEKPRDTYVEAEVSKIKDEIGETTTTQIKVVLICAGMAVLAFFGFVYFFASAIVGILLMGISVYVISKQPKVWKNAKNKRTELEKVQSNYRELLLNKKKSIATIVKNKDMSWAEKDAAVKRILSA